jgi:hypothetical protein
MKIKYCIKYLQIVILCEYKIVPFTIITLTTKCLTQKGHRNNIPIFDERSLTMNDEWLASAKSKIRTMILPVRAFVSIETCVTSPFRNLVRGFTLFTVHRL